MIINNSTGTWSLRSTDTDLIKVGEALLYPARGGGVGTMGILGPY